MDIHDVSETPVPQVQFVGDKLQIPVKEKTQRTAKKTTKSLKSKAGTGSQKRVLAKNSQNKEDDDTAKKQARVSYDEQDQHMMTSS